MSAAALAYLALYALTVLSMVLIGGLRLVLRRRHPAVGLRVAAPALPGVTVVIAARNERRALPRTLEVVRRLRYPVLEVLLVNDGSTDDTLLAIGRELQLEPVPDRPRNDLQSQHVHAVLRSRVDPRVRVIDKRNGGKADALNAGLAYASHPLLLVLDADVWVAPDALERLVRPFVEDASTLATTGTIRISNGCRLRNAELVEARLPAAWLEAFQALEYLRAYGVGRQFFDAIGAHLIVSGAFGLFRKDAVVQLGGFRAHAIGEDMELVVRAQIRRRDAGLGCRIVFVPDALALTEAPASLHDLGRQRRRWQQGLLTSLRLHAGVTFRPRFGSVGLLAMPYFVLFELLSPLIEVAALLATAATALAGDVRWLLALLAITWLGNTLASLAALAADSLGHAFYRRRGDVARLAILALLEPLLYRPFTVVFRLQGIYRYYREIQLRTGWVSPTRRVSGEPARRGVPGQP